MLLELIFAVCMKNKFSYNFMSSAISGLPEVFKKWI